MAESGETPLLRRLVGDALRGYRTDQGRTLRDVAAAARVSVPYLSEVERGRKEASSEVLAAVCKGLDVRLSDLLEQVRRELVARESARPAGLGFVPGQPLRAVRVAAPVGAPVPVGAQQPAGAGDPADAPVPVGAQAPTDPQETDEPRAARPATGPTCLADGPLLTTVGRPRRARRRPGQGRPDSPPASQSRAAVIPTIGLTSIVA
jgi:transcriptional regulator with XRE-family HTH domain